MGTRYVYEHPAEAGFGEHHADPEHPPLEERSATRHGAEGAPQHPAMPGELTMADLDMKHGTVVTHAGVAEESGHVIVEWVDGLGHDRATTIAPDTFAELFREVD